LEVEKEGKNHGHEDVRRLRGKAADVPDETNVEEAARETESCRR
jgi:hypothetical protein